jgi:hypothetical protein
MTRARVRQMKQAINKSWNKREKYQLLSNKISITIHTIHCQPKVFSKLEKQRPTVQYDKNI